jgi:hypothetical protein
MLTLNPPEWWCTKIMEYFSPPPVPPTAESWLIEYDKVTICSICTAYTLCMSWDPKKFWHLRQWEDSPSSKTFLLAYKMITEYNGSAYLLEIILSWPRCVSTEHQPNYVRKKKIISSFSLYFWSLLDPLHPGSTFLEFCSYSACC